MNRILAAMLVVFAVCAPVLSQSSPSVVIADIAAKIKSKDVVQIEVLYMDPNILTLVRVTPEDLKKRFEYKVLLTSASGRSLPESLMKSLENTRVTESKGGADVRWGVIFERRDGSPVGEIYFDKWGKRGAVNGSTVSFENVELFKWLSERGHWMR
ncbi:hypothetical protein Acid345_0233 [Candidatus Koribacter versatilis Ellin345]|uniref:DUF4430 domain-containing protein n=1 Tax=Koribacter versatilis (strain Ellin345) TaxID=204669 RepID=Q1IV62_KORVE|nr:hypothetical protein [Candidatus Koribacter versatilis]ABF39238.1 hypothetical protein Acid345_0233 [Candidatus Koribacter versatilis Ellin345]